MSSRAPIHATTAKYFPHALVSLRWAVLAFTLLTLIFLVPAAWGAGGPTFQGGSGTASDPYLITDANQLSRFRDEVNGGNDFAGKTVKLAADIDLAHGEWTPIGASTRKGSGVTSESTPFRGTFDGAGHSVSGLSITTSPSADYAVGLFGAVVGGTVSNVQLDNVSLDVPGSELAGAAVGLLTGGGTVSGVSVSGSITAHAGVGGVVGRMTLTGTIADCSNSASVTAMTGVGNVGGIVGAAYYTTPDGKMAIENCENTGAVKGTQAVGGIAGLNSAFATACKNSGVVEGAHYSVGGIVGEQKNYGGIRQCTNTATITCEESDGYGCGGIAGWVRYDGVAAAYPASAPVSVTGNDNSGDIHGGNDAGGIVGCFYNAGTVTGNTNSAGTLTSSQFGGGIVGNLQNAPLSSLPKSVTEGITVENNVSSTPIDKIETPLRDLYAYNNTPTDFTVQDNGTTWAAVSGNQRFATLQEAVDDAPDGGTVQLTSDLTAAPTLSLADGRTVTLNLAGHSLAFAQEPAFSVDWGTFIVTGEGTVGAPAAASPTKDAGLIAVAGSSAKPAAVQLEGGSYSADVEPYVAPKYAELVRDQKDAAGKFSVMPAKEARAKAKAKVESNGKTVYYESAQAAEAAAKADPAAKVTALPTPEKPESGSDEPSQPEKPASGSDQKPAAGADAPQAAPATHDGSAAAHNGSTPAFLGGHRAQNAATANTPTKGGAGVGAFGTGATRTASTATSTAKARGSVPQTGDPLADAALAIGLLAVVSGGAVFVARRRHAA